MEAKIQADSPLWTFEIDPMNLLSFTIGLLENARENMLRKDGIVLPHVAFIPYSKPGMAYLPLGLGRTEEAIEYNKRKLRKLLEDQNAERAAVVLQAAHMPIPMLSGVTSTTAPDDPNVEEVIIVEAADINDHLILIQPYYRGENGKIVFDEFYPITKNRITS
jgi:hypothetical protein